MVKYENHFSEADEKKLRKCLRLLNYNLVVSDLNWNAALNDQKEVHRDDFGIEVST